MAQIIKSKTFLKSIKYNHAISNYMARQFSSLQGTSPENHYDVIIAGGGMIGTTLACTLGKNTRLAEKKILLLEGSKQKDLNVSETYSNRVSSLNPGTIQLMKDINIWPHIEAIRYAVVQRMQVWDAISDTMISFDNNSQFSNETNFVAYIVENDVILGAVGKEISNCKNVDVVYEAKIKEYCLPDDKGSVSKINLENGKTYTCKLLLGCDGANSKVRQAMGSQYLSWNYDQMGVVATLKIKTDCPNNDVAWQRFLPTGPVALLPLTKELSSLVWSTSPKDANHLLQLPEDQFVDCLNDAIWRTHDRKDIIHKTTKLFDNFLSYLNCPPNSVRQLPPTIVGCEKNSRAAFPLGFGHSSSYISKGVALVGDAAHRVHPLAGQGVNLGFGDVSCLNTVLGNAVYDGSKIENLNYLRKYESERQRHNIPTMIAIEGLHRLYTNEFTPVVLLRSLGLQATNVLTPLKKLIMAQAAV